MGIYYIYLSMKILKFDNFFLEISPSLLFSYYFFLVPMILWYTILSMCMIIIVRVGHFCPFLKNFQLRYSGPVKKLQNGLNKKKFSKKNI